jgi:hypothetical protein
MSRYSVLPLLFLALGCAKGTVELDPLEASSGNASCSTPSVYYMDADGDGYGRDNAGVMACTAPAGYAPTPGDCDDGNPAFNPGAEESDCTDPNDYNCDGAVGPGDDDGDGFAACEDCDDTNAAVYPGAPEACGGVDSNCDGTTGNSTSATVNFYLDADGDGYGDPSQRFASCEAPDGYVEDNTDCDDSNPDVNPNAAEVCDDGDVDEDCDGLADDNDRVDPDAAPTWYADADGDGYGNAADSLAACDAPDGYVDDNTDCYDGNSSAYPGATAVDWMDRGDGSHDYNCDGEETPTILDQFDCATGTTGWKNEIPPCGGEAGYYVTAVTVINPTTCETRGAYAPQICE